MNRRKFLGYLGCSCCSMFLPSCTTAPITERKQLKIISEAKLNAQAAAIYEKVKKKAKMRNDKNQLGILVCGSGTGMSMTANNHKNIRAALCYNNISTKLSRLHNDANVMTIGSRLIKKDVALKCVSTFLKTNFSGGRHLRRIKKI